MAGMAVKVNLKKYLKIEARWQFVPVLRVNGLPKPFYVALSGAGQGNRQRALS